MVYKYIYESMFFYYAILLYHFQYTKKLMLVNNTNLSVAIRRSCIFICHTAYHYFGCTDTLVDFGEQLITTSHLADIHPTAWQK